MERFGFSVGSSVSTPAIILCALLGALILFAIAAAIARGRDGKRD